MRPMVGPGASRGWPRTAPGRRGEVGRVRSIDRESPPKPRRRPRLGRARRRHRRRDRRPGGDDEPRARHARPRGAHLGGRSREAEPALDDADRPSSRPSRTASTPSSATARGRARPRHVRRPRRAPAGDHRRARSSSTRSTPRPTDLRVSMASVPHAGADWALQVSADSTVATTSWPRRRPLTSGLEDDWAAFTGRALDAATMRSLLTRHDEETAIGGGRGHRRALPGRARPPRRVRRDDRPGPRAPRPAREDRPTSRRSRPGSTATPTTTRRCATSTARSSSPRAG